MGSSTPEPPPGRPIAGTRKPWHRTAKVIEIDVTRPLAAIDVGRKYDEVLLVVRYDTEAIGQVWLSAGGVITAERQWEVIANRLGPALVRAGLRRTARGRTASDPVEMRVSVIVTTRERPDQLETCLESISNLHTQPQQVVVVDNTAEGDAATADLARRFGALHLVEPIPGQTRARNLGLLHAATELVAFTDDDVIVAPDWLDRLEEPFADPLTMAVTGYIGPLELESPAQYTFERHGGFERHPRRRVFDGANSPLHAAAIAGAGANMVFRKAVFSRVGNFAEELGPGTPARSSDDKYMFYVLLRAGYRIVYEPSRRVWHRHRRDMPALHSIFNDYGTAEFAYTTMCLFRHGETAALSLWGWWLKHYARELLEAATPGPTVIPMRLALSETRGALNGPIAMWRSSRSRRTIPPHPAPEASPAPTRGLRESRVVLERPGLSVAIATYNRRESLRMVLRALAAQDLPAERYEVTVVVDGSTDGTAEAARSMEVPYRLDVVEQTNRGLAATRNRGAREARNPVVVFLDDDIEPARGFLAAHADAQAGLASPTFVMGAYPPAIDDGSLWSMSLRAWWEDHFRRKAEPDHTWSFLDVIDGNASVPQRALLEIGAFDERFTGGRRQDYEFGVRALNGGMELGFRPDALGHHHFDPKLETAFRNIRQEGTYDVLLGNIHPATRGRLPLMRLASMIETPRRMRALFDERLRRVPGELSLPALRALEAARQRRRWRSLLNRLLMRSYALGVLDACGTPEAVADFLAPIRERTHSQAEPYLVGSRLALRDASPSAPTDVRVSLGPWPLASVPAATAGDQSDESDLADRLADRAIWPLAVKAALLALDGQENAS